MESKDKIIKNISVSDQFFDRKTQLLILLYKAKVEGKCLISKDFEEMLDLNKNYVCGLLKTLKEEHLIIKQKVKVKKPRKKRVKWEYVISNRGVFLLWQMTKDFPISLRNIESEEYLRELIRMSLLDAENMEEKVNSIIALIKGYVGKRSEPRLDRASIYRDL